MEDKENKTEEATPKRLRDAKKRGQIAKSADLNAAVSFFAFTLLISTLGTYVLNNSLKLMRSSLSRSFNLEMAVSTLRVIFFKNIVQYFLLFLPFALVAMVVGVVINLVQVGFLFTTDPLKPDIKKLNPIEGFKNIFSKKSLFTLVKNMLKLGLVLYMTYKNLIGSMDQLLSSGNIGTEKLFYFLLDFVKTLSFNIAIVMLALAIVDYVFQRRDHKKNLRMSKQEIKDEYKEMEGNPELKSARRQRQRELAMGRMMESVGEATVVITNPTHIAVVIRYDGERDQAPLVTAKGAGHIAEKIKEKAKENKIPIIENKPLARTMYKKVEIGDYVPMDLYKAIAEILAIVYQMRERNKGKI